MVTVDLKVKTIAERIIRNGQWASLYLGYFEASNQFLRDNSGRLDGDAHQMLKVIDIGLPRLCALCLCRLWDEPGKDRHSLPTLVKIADFARVARTRDPSFVRDCNQFRGGKFIAHLTQFRIIDLAHNLPIDGNTKDGFKVDQLREVLRKTQPIIDRVANILRIPHVPLDSIFQLKKDDCAQFWQLVASSCQARNGA